MNEKQIEGILNFTTELYLKGEANKMNKRKLVIKRMELQNRECYDCLETWRYESYATSCCPFCGSHHVGYLYPTQAEIDAITRPMIEKGEV